jgi:tetratricopeptide (TPR) repeat protein
MFGARCCLLAIAPIAMVSVAARAEPAAPSKSKAKAAKAYVDAGLVAQKAGDYDTAITLYTKAYELVPHPVLLFNMAQAHRLAGRVEQALKLYRKYLEEDPKGSEANTARELIAEIEALKADTAREAEAARAAEARTTEVARAAEQAERDHKANRADADDEPSDDGAGAGAGTRKKTASRADDALSDASNEGDAAGTGKPEAPAGHDHDAARSMVLARVGIGGSLAQRDMTYDARQGFPQAPQDLQTFAPAVHIEGEIYPFALSDPTSPLAGFGVVAAYDKTVALVVQQAGTAEASVDQAHYQLGVRYRFVGESLAFALGLDYLQRHFLIDRSSVMSQPIDAPDVDYAAIAPTIVVHVPITTTATIFASVDVPLVYDTGAIQQPESYGKATVYGVEVTSGVYVALARRVGLRVAVEYSRFQLTFDGMGALSNNRDGDPATQDISGAVDRSFGVTATIGVTY